MPAPVRQLAASQPQTLPDDLPASTAADESLDQISRDHIISVLDQCGWKIKGRGNAAERLGLKASTLRYRMKKLGIRRKRGER
jgi:formate hydrogenlyase transcriptional activator